MAGMGRVQKRRGDETMKPTRPALRYYGGKWRLAPWIISYFPDHQNYVEPCGGAASVLLQKPRSPLETYNDLDGNVVNFFRVLRDRPDELIHKIRLTPWAREEYQLHREPVPGGDQVERARRFWVGCSMSISSSPFTASGMRLAKNIDTASNGLSSWLYVDLSHLYEVTDRLRGVQIENKEYSDIVREYDHPETLFYVDPPYVGGTRAKSREYQIEFTDTDHAEAAALLRQAEGYVIVSGYACDLYAELYEAHGWERADRVAQTNGGQRVESLWLSPRTVEALAVPRQMNLFNESSDHKDELP